MPAATAGGHRSLQAPHRLPDHQPGAQHHVVGTRSPLLPFERQPYGGTAQFLDRPLPDLDPHEITQVQVDLTVFDGRVVFER